MTLLFKAAGGDCLVEPPTSALVSPSMVQGPGLNPFGDFLPKSAPSLRSSGRP